MMNPLTDKAIKKQKLCKDDENAKLESQITENLGVYRRGARCSFGNRAIELNPTQNSV